MFLSYHFFASAQKVIIGETNPININPINIIDTDLIPKEMPVIDTGFYVKILPGKGVCIDTSNMNFDGSIVVSATDMEFITYSEEYVKEPNQKINGGSIDLIGFSRSTKDSTCVYYIYPDNIHKVYCECADNKERYQFGDLSILLIGCKMFAFDSKLFKQYIVCHD